MDIAATLQEINALSVEERIHLVQEIWDGIAAEQTFPELTATQTQELDRRLAASDLEPNNVLTWDEIRTSIQKHK